MARVLSYNIPNKIMGIRLVAVVETLVYLSVLVLLNEIWGDGKRFINVGLHPFWVIVLLTSVQYGLNEGLVAAVLSILFLYVGNVPPMQGDETFFAYQYRLGFLPVLWLLAAFILGRTRDQLDIDKKNLHQELHKAREEAMTISNGYETMRGKKESLEIHLTGLQKTTAMVYNTFQAMEKLDPAVVLSGVSSVVQTALNPKKFSIYSYGPNGFEAAIAHGWQSTDSYLRRIPPSQPLCQEIAQKKRLVCVVNPEDEKILQKQGVLAGPLIDPKTKEVFGMLKIEDMDLLELNSSNMATFKIISQLISQAYSNARGHQKMQSKVYDSDLGLYSYELYGIQSDYLKKVCQAGRLPLSTIKIEDHFPAHEGNKETLRIFLKKIREALPPIAEMFMGKTDRELLILLPGQNSSDAQKLGKKIHDEVIAQYIKDNGKVKVDSEALVDVRVEAVL